MLCDAKSCLFLIDIHRIIYTICKCHRYVYYKGKKTVVQRNIQYAIYYYIIILFFRSEHLLTDPNSNDHFFEATISKSQEILLKVLVQTWQRQIM